MRSNASPALARLRGNLQSLSSSAKKTAAEVKVVKEAERRRRNRAYALKASLTLAVVSLWVASNQLPEDTPLIALEYLDAKASELYKWVGALPSLPNLLR